MTHSAHVTFLSISLSFLINVTGTLRTLRHCLLPERLTSFPEFPAQLRSVVFYLFIGSDLIAEAEGAAFFFKFRLL
ncbi:hypothetical protein XELAEV_18000419mg [Xenopus laevis]|uniref:Secreted protein n=1 Tax=Xenopus laevis TaxID=8355 RepID=A0A974BQ22_XENLA|nr:hypothetical protein XELAEV_18000419mg [Xenopus laevis]